MVYLSEQKMVPIDRRIYIRSGMLLWQAGMKAREGDARKILFQRTRKSLLSFPSRDCR